MSITIKQQGDTWRLAITEEWEFSNHGELLQVFTELLNKKAVHGQITRPTPHRKDSTYTVSTVPSQENKE